MKREKVLETMLVITVGLLVLFLIFKAKWLLPAAVAIGLIGVFSNFLSEKITWGWMKLAEVLGRVNASILLSIVFFAVLTPIALLMRLVRKRDALHLGKAPDTVYETRNHTYTAEDLKNVW